jgi:cystathionine beta-synthase
VQFTPDILAAIGNTPLVKLNKVVDDACATVLVKCEFLNPTGSIKDRMALHIINEAEKQGRLKPGGTIVENTSGNTGLAVAMVAAVKGYRCVFTMPDKMSLEKINMLKAFGAEVVITPTDVPGDSPDHYVNTAKRIAGETPGSYYVDQYHSQLNIDAHYHSTGREIFEQTDGAKFDEFVAGVGTGGTISGVGRYMKEHAPNVRIIGTDPIGSVHYHYFKTGTLPTPHMYKVEGVGEDILCRATDFSVIDDMYQTSDGDSFRMARRLVREEGLFVGGSTGGIVHVALQRARELGPGKTVVTVATDSGTRYITKFLSDAWMKDYGFLEQQPEMGPVETVLRERPQKVITARAEETVGEVVERMRASGVSQVPIVDSDGHPTSIVHEIDILRALHSGQPGAGAPVSKIAQPIGGLIYPQARIEELFKIFETDQVAVVIDQGHIIGVVSPIDLIEHMAGTATT